MHLAAGDIVPADCVILESDNLRVDLSMLTGETAPADRSAEATVVPAGKLQIGDVASLLPAGAAVATGTGTAVVLATGPASTIGLVAGLVTGVQQEASILERQVSALSRLTAVIAVPAGTSTLALAAVFTETTLLSALTFGTGALVALVPEGLLPTLTVSLAIGARRMAERGAAVRRLSAVEVVGSVTVICTDKTGTLTENSLTVEGCVSPDGATQPSPEVFLAAVLCNDARLDGDEFTGDPLDVALWRWAKQGGNDPSPLHAACPRLAGVAFDAKLRYMQVTCEIDGQRRTFAKGAPEEVLKLTSTPTMPPSPDECHRRRDRQRRSCPPARHRA